MAGELNNLRTVFKQMIDDLTSAAGDRSKSVTSLSTQTKQTIGMVDGFLNEVQDFNNEMRGWLGQQTNSPPPGT